MSPDWGLSPTFPRSAVGRRAGGGSLESCVLGNDGSETQPVPTAVHDDGQGRPGAMCGAGLRGRVFPALTPRCPDAAGARAFPSPSHFRGTADTSRSLASAGNPSLDVTSAGYLCVPRPRPPSFSREHSRTESPTVLSAECGDQHHNSHLA